MELFYQEFWLHFWLDPAETAAMGTLAGIALMAGTAPLWGPWDGDTFQ
jgi:hypothetical protein